MKNILLYISLALTSCSQSAFNLMETNLGVEKIKIEIDSVLIPIDFKSQNNYPKNHVTKIGENELLFGYNHQNHSIDVYDLTTEKQLRRIQLDYIGPNQIDRVEGLFVQSFDSIFISSYGYLSHIDSTGAVRTKYSLNNLKLFKDIPEGDLIASSDFNIFYDPLEHSCIFYYKPNTIPYLSGDYLKQPFVARLYLKSDSLITLPITFSQYYFENKGRFGRLTDPNLSIHKNNITYNFPGESNIYAYNMKNNTHSSYGGMSKFVYNTVKPLKGEQTSERVLYHFLNNSYFFKTIYDPHRNLYYRLHWDGVDPTQHENPFGHKSVFLMVFDDQMRLLEELKLNDFTYIVECWFVTSNGLYLNIGHPFNTNRDLESLSFHVYKFNYE